MKKLIDPTKLAKNSESEIAKIIADRRQEMEANNLVITVTRSQVISLEPKFMLCDITTKGIEEIERMDFVDLVMPGNKMMMNAAVKFLKLDFKDLLKSTFEDINSFMKSKEEQHNKKDLFIIAYPVPGDSKKLGLRMSLCYIELNNIKEIESFSLSEMTAKKDKQEEE